MATAWSLPRFGQVRDDRELHSQTQQEVDCGIDNHDDPDYLCSDIIEEL
jgi:hypothetical protein